METYYPKDPVNMETLDTEIKASFPLAGLISDNGGVRVSMPDGTNQATWDAIGVIITAHNPTTLSENQKITAAQITALADARDYLRKQLLNPSPNVATIYSNVKAKIDDNPQLVQMVSNNLTICSNAFVWGVLDLITPTPLTRQRYLFVIELTLGLLA